MAGNLYILSRITVISFGSKRLIRLVCCRPFFIRPSFGPSAGTTTIFLFKMLMRRKSIVFNQIIVLYLFEKNVGNGNQTKTISLFLFFMFFHCDCHFLSFSISIQKQHFQCSYNVAVQALIQTGHLFQISFH